MRASASFLLAMAVIGCATVPAVSWGPLAVARMDFGMQARNVGTLVITDRCVFIERDGARELLVWPADRTSWRSATDTPRVSGHMLRSRHPTIHDRSTTRTNGEEAHARCSRRPRT